MKQLIYAGIGSRKTPLEILNKMYKYGYYFAKLGFILRSGGAIGADTYFERGCDLAHGKKEIYLPRHNISGEAYDLAEKFHPNWSRCNSYARKCHARNSYQILGYTLDLPCDFVLCWSNGTGGTEQAIRVATYYNIPIFNLYKNIKNSLHKFLCESVN